MDTHKNSPSGLKKLLNCAALAACAAALAGCGGGGGGGGDQTPTPVSPAAAMQGFWSGPVTTAPDGATRASTVVMPDGTAWVAYESTVATTGVARVLLSGSGVDETTANVSGSGFYYTLASGARKNVTATGTATTTGTLKGTATIGGAASPFDWTTVAGYKTAAVQGNVTGTWKGSVGTGVVEVTWTLSATGAVTGSSTTGCTYTGTVTPSPGIAVYNVVVSENCAGASTNFDGIATLNTARTNLRMAYITSDTTAGGLINFVKQ